MSDEDSEQNIKKTLQELRNLNLQTDGPVVAKDLREIILRQMELSHALFDRQHQDVLKQIEVNRTFFERQHQDVDQMHSSVRRMTASSRRVEKLTLALIGLTGVLAVMTYLLLPLH